MGVNICLPLFGAPAHELEENPGSKDLRELADALHQRLLAAAEILDRLTQDGWSSQPAMFELLLFHPGVETREQAEQRLRSVGIDPALLMIIEDVEEEEGEQAS
jgi:hypothetical protein